MNNNNITTSIYILFSISDFKIFITFVFTISDFEIFITFVFKNNQFDQPPSQGTSDLVLSQTNVTIIMPRMGLTMLLGLVNRSILGCNMLARKLATQQEYNTWL